MVYKSNKSDRNLKPKEKHRKGLWSPQEDDKLRSYVLNYGHGCWSTVPIKAGLQRNGKSCRLRWVNYLRPGLKRGIFTKEEEDSVLSLHSILGNKWSQISQYLPGRTDNEIKNYWHSYLKKREAATTEETMSPPKSTSQVKVSSLETTNYSSSPTNSLETLITTHILWQSATPGSSPTDAREHINPHRLSGYPKLVFAEWFTSDLVVNGPSQESNVQDFVAQGCVPNEGRFNEMFGQCYSEFDSIDNIMPNSHFWSNDEEVSENDFRNPFSDNCYSGVSPCNDM